MHLLPAGEKAGPEKLRKAEKLGVAVISEEELYAKPGTRRQSGLLF